MDFNDTPEEAAFRLGARSWLETNAPKALKQELEQAGLGRRPVQSIDALVAAKDWQKKKADAGWACIHWPKDYGGRGATPFERVIWDQEEGIYAKLTEPFLIGHGMCGPTIMQWSDEATKRRLLPPTAAGEAVWCQLFSEPSSGSDLAGVRTRARSGAEGWVVDGQKVWTSHAHIADYGMLLARTDPTVPKHQGLTMFYLRMDSPGIEIRPIRQANGLADFNEVFLADVRIPDAQRLGAPGEGWKVALTMLMNERLSIGLDMPTGFPEIFALCRRLRNARGLVIDDPAVRSKLATWAVRHMGLKYTAMRTMSALSRGEMPGPENSIGKLVASSTLQEISIYALDLHGPAAIAEYPGDPALTLFQSMLLRAPGTRLEGGSDEILRNIIAERVLGLPADIRVDKDISFNHLP